jgi:MSHA biogenesis protein MshN
MHRNGVGLFEMSLINKMLQDLEGRRSEGEVVGALHGQIRAAQEPRQIHVAWWLVFGLTLILTGLISWLWGYRSAPPVMANGQMPQLALKLAPNIQMQQAPVPKTQVVEEKTDSVPLSGTTSLPNTKQDSVDHAPNAVADNRPQSNAAGAPVLTPAVGPANAVAALGASSAAPSIAPSSPSAERSPVRPAANKPLTAAAAAKGDAADRPLQKPEKETEFDIPANVTKQIKELSPQQRADEEYRRATVLLDQGKSSESIAVLEKALQLDPQHSVARQTLASLLLEGKRHDEAIRALQAGLNLDKSHSGLAMMLARLQVDKGGLRPAIETLQGTLPYAIDRADYQAFLAALLQREGRHKEAAEHYLIALRKSPQNGLWWMGIAISLQGDNRLAEARDAFGRAKAANNLSPELLAFVEQKLQQLR